MDGTRHRPETPPGSVRLGVVSVDARAEGAPFQRALRVREPRVQVVVAVAVAGEPDQQTRELAAEERLREGFVPVALERAHGRGDDRGGEPP